VHFKLSLGDGSAVVDAGTMSPESVAEGVQFTEALLNQEESDGTTTSENVAAWLWESLDDLPTAIEQLQEAPGPFHGFEEFVISVLAPDEIALLPWELLQPPVVRRTLLQPSRGRDACSHVSRLGAAFTQGLGVPFFVPLDHIQLEERLLERVDGSLADLACEFDGRAFDLAIVNLQDGELDEELLRRALSGRGVGLLAAAVPAGGGKGLRDDGLLRLQRAAVVGAGIPSVFCNRHAAEEGESVAALEGFIEQALKGIPLAQCAKNVQNEHGIGWVLWSNIRNQPFLQMEPPDVLDCAPASARPTLEIGEAGASVRMLQQRLERLGLPVGPGRADGIFGTDTERAVMALQRLCDMVPGGKVSEETWARMDLLEAGQGPAAASGIVPRGARPFRDGEVLGDGVAGPRIDTMGEEARYLFGSAVMREGVLDQAATRAWAEAQEALDQFPSRTFSPWALPADVELDVDGEGELRWLPLWLCDHAFGGIPGIPGGPATVITREMMESLLEVGATAATATEAAGAPVATRAALEYLLSRLSDATWAAPDTVPHKQPGDSEVPAIVAFLDAAEMQTSDMTALVEEQLAETEKSPIPEEPETEEQADDQEDVAANEAAPPSPEPAEPDEQEQEPQDEAAEVEGAPQEPPAEDQPEADDAAVLARVDIEQKVPPAVLASRSEGLDWEERVQEPEVELLANGEEPQDELKLPSTTEEMEALIAAEIAAAERMKALAREGTGNGNGNGTGENYGVEEAGQEDRGRPVRTWSGQYVAPFLTARPVVQVEGDEPLTLPRRGGPLEDVLDQIHGRFSLPLSVTAKLLSELEAGRNVVLTGPPGTGKSSLAQAVARALGFYPVLTAPTADRTASSYAGDIYSARDGAAGGTAGGLFRPGVVLEAVLANWQEIPDSTGPGVRLVRAAGGALEPDGQPARGCWLVLDELDRGDVDGTLGGLFAELASGRLRVPAMTHGWGTVEIPVPRDFRIIATLNQSVRESRARISETLRQRFSFVEIPVASHLGDEWTRVCALREIRVQSGDDLWPDGMAEEEQVLFDDLRRFFYLVRAFCPLGTAQLVSAVRFLLASGQLGMLSQSQRMQQALGGSVLPQLEGVSEELLHVLQVWCAPAEDREEAADEGTRTGQPIVGSTSDEFAAQPSPRDELVAILTEYQTLLADDMDYGGWLQTLEGTIAMPETEAEQPPPQAEVLAQTLARAGGPYEELAYQLWRKARDAALGT